MDKALWHLPLPHLQIITTAVAQTIGQCLQQTVTSEAPNEGVYSPLQTQFAASAIRLQAREQAIEMILQMPGALLSLLAQALSPQALSVQEACSSEFTSELLNVSFGLMDPQFRNLGLHFKCSFPLPVDQKVLSQSPKLTRAPCLSVAMKARHHVCVLSVLAENSLKLAWSYTP